MSRVADLLGLTFSINVVQRTKRCLGMFSHHKSDSGEHRRHVSLADRVDVVEGEVTDPDDLEGEGNGVSFDEYIASTEERPVDLIEVSSDSDDRISRDKKRKRGRGPGEKIAFDDDNDEEPDAVYLAFKKKKGEARKRAIAESKALKVSINKSSMVGRKPRSIVAIKNRDGRPRDAIADNEDEALLETTLPEYLRQRRLNWEEQRTKLKGIGGLQLPPDFQDVEFSDDERMAKLAEKPHFPNSEPQNPYRDIELRYSLGIIPAPIAQWLRDYQVEAVEWLHKLFVYQEGGILGDDMGLGKTIMVIAFLTAAFGKTGDERDAKRMRKIRRMGGGKWYPRVLIICPLGLMNNWKAELETWGWWHVDTLHGKPSEKQAALDTCARGRTEILITTYTTYKLNASQINDVRWDCVVADECHIIKERTSDITKAMNDINALCRIGLSGTAIQNKYEELWTLLNWTSPGRLGSLSVWKQSICVPLKIGQSHDATLPQLAKARRTAEKLVKNLLPRFFKRRTKALIAHQLPKKSDKVVFCPLTEVQATAYNNFCSSETLQVIRNSGERCPCGSGKKQGWCCYATISGVGKWQHHVFPSIHTLANLANHIALLTPNADGKDRDKHDRELKRMKTAVPDLWKTLYTQRDGVVHYANQEFCGKWKVLKKLLQLWHDNGDKVLVFSHSVRLLKMLRTLFGTTTTYNVSYLDGSMNADDRTKAVNDFNGDPSQFVFLISTKAGGVGLNITSANKVVVVDPNWNPAYDLQAQDRAYRIGQTRDVEVFRLVSSGTVEEIVYARQIYKQQQANIGYNASVERRYFKGVQDEKEQKGEIFGLANLFAPQSDNVVLRDIVNKTNIAETRAGVEIAGLDLEASVEDDEENSSIDPLLDERKELEVMSQLAAEIIDEPGAKRKAAKAKAKKSDPVAAILASAGVQYTHDNAQVIGTSKIETKISSRAQKAGNDLDFMNEMAFAELSSQQIESDDKVYSESRNNLAKADAEEAKIRYRYRPPEDIRIRQFCSMARHFGYNDVTEFALVVESWTQQDRRTCLEKFYRERKERIINR
nr:isoform 2 of dna excision repair protein ercc-6-like 2 [Quercus suber]